MAKKAKSPKKIDLGKASGPTWGVGIRSEALGVTELDSRFGNQGNLDRKSRHLHFPRAHASSPSRPRTPYTSPLRTRKKSKLPEPSSNPHVTIWLGDVPPDHCQVGRLVPRPSSADLWAIPTEVDRGKITAKGKQRKFGDREYFYFKRPKPHEPDCLRRSAMTPRQGFQASEAARPSTPWLDPTSAPTNDPRRRVLQEPRQHYVRRRRWRQQKLSQESTSC